MQKTRQIEYGNRNIKILRSWPVEVRDMIVTNIQALATSQYSSFDSLPDWSFAGKLTDKKYQGESLKGARQLTIKHQNSYRVAYIAEFEEVIVVLHCFVKKTEGIQTKSMKTVEARLKAAKDKYGNHLYQI